MEWTFDQQRALEVLQSRDNGFITGGAGTGKSTVIQQFMREYHLNAEKNPEKNSAKNNDEQIAVLASTGTAAILLGGRTFHSFFGLGIMEGGPDYIVERALKHRGIVQRLRKTGTILLDEISMIGAPEFSTAERIARKARNNSAPWGGLRIIVIGDFTQLPPVVRQNRDVDLFSDVEPGKPWCFLTDTWRDSEFTPVYLKTVVRSHDAEWNEILNELRWGQLSKHAQEILRGHTHSVPLDFQGTRLFARRNSVERLNQDRLTMLSGNAREYNTIYIGNAQKVDDLKRNAPIPEVLILKEGALVMFRQNDPDYKFVNGTQGTVVKMENEVITVELLNGRRIEVKPATFSLLDAEGATVATATNFALNLAWACTIHKAQGATLDKVHADLKGVWEHGQAYVALSRVRSLDDLSLEGLSPKSFKVDEAVRAFYSRFDNLISSGIPSDEDQSPPEFSFE
jgi:ATP-dependent DNA helicase PIF1